MSRYLFSGSLVALTLAVVTTSLWARPTAQAALYLPDTPYRYANVELPTHFTQAGRNDDNTPLDNALTDDAATVGRVLFYDTRLSANDTTSCASCHIQAHAFSDPRPASSGFRGALTDRRGMPLVNLRYYQRARFFWDERAGNLEAMVLQPIQSRVEMGQDLKTLVELLSRDSVYPSLFERAFGDPPITEERIGKALAQFVRSMVSYQSRYDEGRARARSAHDDFDTFTRQENRGKALFMRHCSNCHMKGGNEHFFVATPANTGLRPNDPSADGGVGDVTLRAADLGAFKSPSLRNVEVTAPYGHDGRFATLGAVIDQYSENAVFDVNLGYVIPLGPLKFTASEKAALIAFLTTLTDPKFLSDPKFSNPFLRSQHSAATRHPFSRGATVAMIPTAIPAAATQRRARPVPAVLITPLPEQAPRQTVPDSSAVLDRILSFDTNRDDRITRGELPERMEGLVSRGDKNQDGFLTPDEIVALVDTRPTTVGRGPLTMHGPGSLADVIADLKLPPVTHDQAMEIVNGHSLSSNINDPDSTKLYVAMRELLGDEDYENFVAAAARLRNTARVIGGIVGGVVRIPAPAPR
jgi:cytochrome c peroxidase